MIRHLQLALLIVASVTIASGCQRGTRDLEQWVNNTLQTPAGEIEPIPPIAPTEVVTYEAYDLRDPFQQRLATPDEESEQTAGSDGGVRPDPDRRREFLESFPPDTLDMVGTIELDGVNYALIRDNDRVVHRVSEGNYLGTNHGRVIRVQPNRVELVELFEDARGGWTERRSQIAMEEGS